MNNHPIRHMVAAIALLLALTAGCAASTTPNASPTTAPAATSSTSTSPASTSSTSAAEEAASGTTAVEAIDPVATADVAALPEQTIQLGSDVVTLTAGGTYTLTGNGTGGVVVDTDDDIVLVLDNVNLVSDTGAAIAVLSADNVFLTLADGSVNHLEDASTRTDPEVNGTLYSDADISISGTGTLTVVGNHEDGIVTKDDLEITSGIIVVTATDDAVRGRDSVTITGGQVSITAGGDGIKTTNEEEIDRGWVHITGGAIAIDAGDDAIKAQTTMTIDGGTIDVVDSYEGLEAINITINDGDITIYASDDGINAVAGLVAAEVFIEVNGGMIDVTVGSGDTDAFDSNGSLLITGGTIDVTAPTSSFDVDGTAQLQAGTVTVNGQQVTELPQSRMGGPGGGGRGGDRPGG